MDKKDSSTEPKVESVEKVVNHLVISGGGVKGISFCGAFRMIKELHESGKILLDLKSICGVSVGSIIGLMYTIGYTYTEMEKVILDTNLNSLKHVRIYNMISNYGLDSGKELLQWITSLLTSKGYSTNLTFSELYDKTGINFRVVATNLNKHSQVIFDKDSYPDFHVLLAVRMSFSIPFVFGRVKYKGETFVDGALINNFPIDIYKHNLNTTLGLCIITDDDSDYDVLDNNIDSFEDYVNNVLKCFLAQRERLGLTPNYKKHSVCIYINDVSGIDFKMSNEKKINLLRDGYMAVKNFFM
jgi:NTE family protein